MRTFMGYNRTHCDCPECALNCQYIPGYLLPTDLPRLATFHGAELDPNFNWQHQDTHFHQFILQNLLASPGALVLKNGKPCRIRTIVPARNVGGCKLLDGKLCTIHSVAPFGCAFFDSHQEPPVSNAISGAGLRIIARLWRDDPHSLYCQIWNELHQKGMRALSPEQCRQGVKNHSLRHRQ
jgi:Fe-S-cluster containining protein